MLTLNWTLGSSTAGFYEGVDEQDCTKPKYESGSEAKRRAGGRLVSVSLFLAFSVSLSLSLPLDSTCAQTKVVNKTIYIKVLLKENHYLFFFKLKRQAGKNKVQGASVIRVYKKQVLW